MRPAPAPEAAAATDAAPFAAVDTARIREAATTPEEWLTYGGTYDEQRHARLTKINADNVGRLGVAWTYDLATARGVESTPIVVDGVMYVTSAWSVVYALDAATGEELWVYDPDVDRAVGVKACCDVVNRGVAVYGGKILVGVIDGRLEALDAKTGERIWSTVTVDQSKPYTVTGAPRVVDGKVLIGNGGAELGVRGYLSAYDVDSGKLVWRFYTAPNPDKEPDGAASDAVFAEFANATWGDEGAWKSDGGGGTVWDSIVYDEVNDRIIFGVGNGSPWNQRMRDPSGGDNLFVSLHRRRGRLDRRIRLALPDHARRQLGLHRHPDHHPRRPAARRRRRAPPASPCRRPRTASSTCWTLKPETSSPANPSCP